MNKENSKHSIANKVKDSRATLRKPTPRGEEVNRPNERSNSQSRKSLFVKNNIEEQSQKDKRKTISPNIMTVNSSQPSKSVAKNNNLKVPSKKIEEVVKLEKTPEKEIGNFYYY